jgi:hypothetical protein
MRREAFRRAARPTGEDRRIEAAAARTLDQTIGVATTSGDRGVEEASGGERQDPAAADLPIGLGDPGPVGIEAGAVEGRRPGDDPVEVVGMTLGFQETLTAAGRAAVEPCAIRRASVEA